MQVKADEEMTASTETCGGSTTAVTSPEDTLSENVVGLELPLRPEANIAHNRASNEKNLFVANSTRPFPKKTGCQTIMWTIVFQS